MDDTHQHWASTLTCTHTCARAPEHTQLYLHTCEHTHVHAFTHTPHTRSLLLY